MIKVSERSFEHLGQCFLGCKACLLGTAAHCICFFSAAVVAMQRTTPLQVDASSLFDPYDRHVRHAPDVISTATSPTVSVSLSPKDSLSVGGAGGLRRADLLMGVLPCLSLCHAGQQHIPCPGLAVQTVTKRGVGGSSFVAGYRRILTPEDSLEAHTMLGVHTAHTPHLSHDVRKHAPAPQCCSRVACLTGILHAGRQA